MHLWLGQSQLSTEFVPYVTRFSALEVSTDRGRAPRPERLRRWRAEAPADFLFSVALPAQVTALDSADPGSEEFERAIAAASTLAARWVVLRTPPSVRPNPRSAEQLRRLVERIRAELPRLAPSVELGWEPSGLWESEQSKSLAHRLGLHLIVDVSREQPAPGAALYTRIRRIGTNLRVGAGSVQRIVERALAFERVVVIAEGDAAGMSRLIGAELGALGLAEPRLGDPGDDPEADRDDSEGDDEMDDRGSKKR